MQATRHNSPFRHWLVRDVVDPALLYAARDAVPAADRPEWVRYDNDLERGKWTMEAPEALTPAWSALLDALQAPTLLAYLRGLTMVPDLRPDPSRRGAGLHLMFPGGHLSTHVDYALHPSGLERRCNLILFVDDVVRGLGGGLRLCDASGKAVETYWPSAGEAVVWECGDDTYHGVEPLSREGLPRLTAAAYYLSSPRPGCSRRRALFFPER